MSAVSREQLRALMGEVLEAQGKTLPADESADLQKIGFRSLDFSELALRVEDEIGEELNFDAAGLRQITTVGDVLDCHRDPGRLSTPCRPRSPARTTPWSTSRTGVHDHVGGAAQARAARPPAAVVAPSSFDALPAVWAHARTAPSSWSSRAAGCEQNLRDELLDAGLRHRRGDERRRAPPTPREPEDGRLWLLTSGSTGRPKRIGHTLESLTTVTGEQAPATWLCPYSPGHLRLVAGGHARR